MKVLCLKVFSLKKLYLEVNCSYFHLKEYEADALQRRFSGGSHSYGGESPRLSPCGSIGILSKSDEQLSSLEQDSGQCSRNTSCETLGECLNHYWGSYFEIVACQAQEWFKYIDDVLSCPLVYPDTAESYDPDYDFLHQDLSSIDQIPPAHSGGCLSPLPESHHESSSSPVQFQSIPPALPKKERRTPLPPVERLYSQYDNVPDEDVQTPPFPLFPSMPPSSPGVFMENFGPAENTQVPQSPPPLPEKKSRHSEYEEFKCVVWRVENYWVRKTCLVGTDSLVPGIVVFYQLLPLLHSHFASCQFSILSCSKRIQKQQK